ncbi:outer membrane protein assembly factor BamB family protein [Myxococcus dinghuensis]|uniref:outer membrane protein assembly factor BamB family protein n=1 Tax=Myxococcus dinghuensis TaxID=2906761 RepID=UPI002B1F0497|nr:PQQ-binding-like beta-propeller repeat protein [Myxococcus dinghuensis]
MLPTLVLTVVAAVGCREPAETAFRYSTDASSRAGLTALSDGVLTGNEAGAVLRVNRAGDVVWRVELGREVATRPVVAADSVVVGTVAGDLARLALSDGTERWRLTGEAPVLTPPVAEEDGTAVYVVAPDGAVRSHAVDTGKVRWRTPAPKADEAHLDPARGLPAPVLSEGLLVVALGDVGLVALSTADGARAWRQEVRGVLGLAATKDVVFATTREHRVRAMRLEDGSPLWEQSPARALTSPPSLALGTLWVGARVDDTDVLVGLSPSEGKEVARLPLPAPLVTGVAEAHGEQLVVPTNGRQGRLVVLAPRDPAHAISLRTDTPLRTRPVVLGGQVFVLGMDGRVLSWRLRPPKS